ncbi:hypothetical protein [Nitrosarchaeum sp. AC2]|uniref:hypothetical protein n=1 Tax=Nitrosarchaeum sp. AC2 TaxID=2259673 RepID=UPI0015CD0322|nr:hypothetical protein [Nitrosarchaeum sp. AC2]QLH11261.1 hypothetical protein DSQ20_07155 [Nitrosarchaeum sp. AC2]
MSDDKLANIQDLLEDIKGLLLLSNQDKIEEAKSKLLKPGSVEESVYKLCDGTNTTVDIMTSIQKDQKYTNTVLGILRHKGLIKTVEKNGNKVHEQRF